MSFGSSIKSPLPPKKLGNLDSDSLNSDQEAVPVPWMAGRRRVSLKWFTPAYNQVNERVTQQAGKGSKETTVGWIYYVDVGGLIAIGGRRPGDKLYKVIVEREILWRNESGLARDTDFYEPITIPNFGTARIYWGYPLQPVDTLVLTPRGAPPGGSFDPRDPSTWPNGNQTTQHPSSSNLGHYDAHPAYRNDWYLILKKAKCGQGREQMPTVELEVGRGVAWFGDS